MAQMTRRHRILIERKLERIKQREGRGIVTRKPTTVDINRTRSHRILDKTSQPLKEKEESDSQ